MSYIPVVQAFISFYELDPASRPNCIYVLRNGNTCRWPRKERAYNLATALRRKITTSPPTEVSISILQEYIKNNCCMSGNAKHQERIEDVNMLEPLAQRWLDEINSHAKTVLLPAAATPGQKPATIFAKSPILPTSKYQQSESRPRYDLRSGNVDGLIYRSRRSSLTLRSPISEFRPHIANPLAGDSVVGKIVEPLMDRDFETGSLYIFSRESSPGYVKIGWTAKSIQGRLDVWADCGYTPNLLFSEVSVRNARRAETLTHYELIKEWRRERRCKADHCQKSHQEWFEVSTDRASAILKNWADFLNKARPYGNDGDLKPKWWLIVKMMEKKGEFITSQKLLERYQKMQRKAVTPITPRGCLHQAPNFQKEEEVPAFLGNERITEQKTSSRQDNRVLKDTELTVFSSMDEKLEKSVPNPAEDVLLCPGPVKQELLPEEIPLPISPRLPPMSDCTINSETLLLL